MIPEQQSTKNVASQPQASVSQSVRKPASQPESTPVTAAIGAIINWNTSSYLTDSTL